MPFGLRNASQTFQRFIDSVMCGLDFVFVYIDDVLIASVDESEHFVHLETVFQRLADNGLVVNPDKCHLGQASVEYLARRAAVPFRRNSRRRLTSRFRHPSANCAASWG